MAMLAHAYLSATRVTAEKMTCEGKASDSANMACLACCLPLAAPARGHGTRAFRNAVLSTVSRDGPAELVTMAIGTRSITVPMKV